MAWRVANSLNVLRDQINEKSPNRSKASDGTIADESHSATSDHVPHNFPGWGNEIVTARDITHDPAHGADMLSVAEGLRESRDHRVKYVIWGNRMYSSYATSNYSAWTWRPYLGAFHSHLHVSTVGDGRADLTDQWDIVQGQGVQTVPLTNDQNNALAETWAATEALRDGDANTVNAGPAGIKPMWPVARINEIIAKQNAHTAEITIVKDALGEVKQLLQELIEQGQLNSQGNNT